MCEVCGGFPAGHMFFGDSHVLVCSWSSLVLLFGSAIYRNFVVLSWVIMVAFGWCFLVSMFDICFVSFL